MHSFLIFKNDIFQWVSRREGWDLGPKTITQIRQEAADVSILFEPHPEKTCLCNVNKDTDQPEHQHSNFVIHCLDNMIPTVAVSGIIRSSLAAFDNN